MLIAIVGRLGQGKTLTMTYFLLRDKVVKKRFVVANYRVKFADKIIQNPAELYKIENASVGLDEAWVWIDARTTQSTRNKIVSHILLASRKKELDIYFTSQHLKQLDVRVRRVLDLIIVPNYINPQRCEVWILDSDGEPVEHFWFRPKPIFSLYSTRQVIKLKSLDELIKEIEQDEEVMRGLREYGTEYAVAKACEKYALNKTQARTIIKIIQKKA